MRKKVKIWSGGFWQSFTNSVNSMVKKNDNFYLILEEVLVGLSLGQIVEGFLWFVFFFNLGLTLLHITLET